MPVSPDVLGFANSWYPEAVRTAIRVALDERISIRLIAAPAFVATKLEAFATRGRNDFLASHDLEDVLNVIEGRPRLVDEMRAADPGLRAAVQSHFRRLLAEQDFVENLPGMVRDADLGELLLQRLRDMAV